MTTQRAPVPKRLDFDCSTPRNRAPGLHLVATSTPTQIPDEQDLLPPAKHRNEESRSETKVPTEHPDHDVEQMSRVISTKGKTKKRKDKINVTPSTKPREKLSKKDKIILASPKVALTHPAKGIKSKKYHTPNRTPGAPDKSARQRVSVSPPLQSFDIVVCSASKIRLKACDSKEPIPDGMKIPGNYDQLTGGIGDTPEAFGYLTEDELEEDVADAKHITSKGDDGARQQPSARHTLPQATLTQLTSKLRSNPMKSDTIACFLQAHPLSETDIAQVILRRCREDAPFRVVLDRAFEASVDVIADSLRYRRAFMRRICAQYQTFRNTWIRDRLSEQTQHFGSACTLPLPKCYFYTIYFVQEAAKSWCLPVLEAMLRVPDTPLGQRFVHLHRSRDGAKTPFQHTLFTLSWAIHASISYLQKSKPDGYQQMIALLKQMLCKGIDITSLESYSPDQLDRNKASRIGGGFDFVRVDVPELIPFLDSLTISCEHLLTPHNLMVDRDTFPIRVLRSMCADDFLIDSWMRYCALCVPEFTAVERLHEVLLLVLEKFVRQRVGRLLETVQDQLRRLDFAATLEAETALRVRQKATMLKKSTSV